MFVLGQRRERAIERVRGVTEEGSDRNYYSNSLCRCLEISSPSLVFYLLPRSSPLHLPVCLRRSLPMSFLFALPLPFTPVYVLPEFQLIFPLLFFFGVPLQGITDPSFTSSSLVHSTRRMFTHLCSLIIIQPFIQLSRVASQLFT